MQKFKNGAPVTVTYAENGKTRGGNHIGMKGLLHVVNLETGGFCEFGDDYIKPVQLICDEAREVIKTQKSAVNPEYKVNIKTEEIFNELAGINQHLPLFIHSEFRTTEEKKARFDSKNLPELNLETGEVIPFVDDNFNMEVARSIVKDLRKALKEKDARIKEIEDIHSDAMISLGGQLKEKDTGIERLKNTINSMSDDIKCAVDNITDWIK